MISLNEPTPRQLAALGSALLRGDGAVAAWERLRAESNFLDETDIATFRMLPMVYRNLREAGVPEAELGPLKGVYRQWWLRTRLTLGGARQALAVLQSVGVEPIALKGMGLVATAYREAALRPMHDIDFLFEAGMLPLAAQALSSAGWRPLRGSSADYRRRLRVFHALPFVSPNGLEIDLHQNMLEENVYRGADAPAFRRLVWAEVDGMRFRTLSPEDHLINACVHGVRWDPTPALRWVIDVVVAIRAAAEQFDWPYVEGEAVRRGVTAGMAGALDFARRFEPSIPAELPGRLASRAGRLERWNFRAQQGGNGVGVQIARYLGRYERLVSHRNVVRKVTDFPVYLECMWELDRPRQVPMEGVRRVWRGLRA